MEFCLLKFFTGMLMNQIEIPGITAIQQPQGCQYHIYFKNKITT